MSIGHPVNACKKLNINKSNDDDRVSRVGDPRKMQYVEMFFNQFVENYKSGNGMDGKVQHEEPDSNDSQL